MISFREGSLALSFALCWFDEYNLYLPVKPCSNDKLLGFLEAL